MLIQPFEVGAGERKADGAGARAMKRFDAKSALKSVLMRKRYTLVRKPGRKRSR